MDEQTAVELIRRSKENKGVNEVVTVRRSQRIVAMGLIVGPPATLILTANEN